jgi:hypothetical protein
MRRHCSWAAALQQRLKRHVWKRLPRGDRVIACYPSCLQRCWCNSGWLLSPLRLAARRRAERPRRGARPAGRATILSSGARRGYEQRENNVSARR